MGCGDGEFRPKLVDGFAPAIEIDERFLSVWEGESFHRHIGFIDQQFRAKAKKLSPGAAKGNCRFDWARASGKGKYSSKFNNTQVRFQVIELKDGT
ncbi:MAG: hypothetical protein ACK52Z_15055 [Acidobacteriota bacterium]